MHGQSQNRSGDAINSSSSLRAKVGAVPFRVNPSESTYDPSTNLSAKGGNGTGSGSASQVERSPVSPPSARTKWHAQRQSAAQQQRQSYASVVKEETVNFDEDDAMTVGAAASEAANSKEHMASVSKCLSSLKACKDEFATQTRLGFEAQLKELRIANENEGSWRSGRYSRKLGGEKTHQV